MSRVKVAAAQYPIEELTTFDAIENKIKRWVKTAAYNAARLLVFPEYGSLELSRLGGVEVSQNLASALEEVQAHLPSYERLFEEAARDHGVFILAPSVPVRLGADGRYINRATLFAPSGGRAHQDKQLMTRFEQHWGVSSNPGLAVFDIGLLKLGIAICYDSEFPLIARTLSEAGAQVLLVPSCTDTLAGHHRVASSCRARAIENQIYVVQSATVGEAAWSAAVDVNIGRAGIFGPADQKLSDDGVFGLGVMNEPGWIYADLDLEGLSLVRGEGEVLNNRDWDLQPGISPLPQVPLIRLV